MLKKLLVTGGVLGLVTCLYGQGQVNFDTRGVGTPPTINAPVFDAPQYGGALLGTNVYGPGLQGTNWFAQLYAAAGTGVSSASLQPVGQPVNFLQGTRSGFVQTGGTTTLGVALTPSPPGPGSVVNIPFLTAGGPATVQVRAWWGGGTLITTFEQAFNNGQPDSNNPHQEWGWSQTLNLLSTGDASASPAILPVDMSGLQGFQLQAVPEPSTFALAGLGAAALVIFRRRK